MGFSHLNYEKQILKEDTSNTVTFTQWSAGQNSARKFELSLDISSLPWKLLYLNKLNAPAS